MPPEMEQLRNAIAALEERQDEQDKILSRLWQRSNRNRRSIDRTTAAFMAFLGLLVVLTLFGLRLQDGKFSFDLSGEVLVSLVSALGALLAASAPTIDAAIERWKRGGEQS